MTNQSQPSSYSLPCPLVLLNDIVTLEVPYRDFSGTDHVGKIQVHASIQNDIIEAFRFMRELSFPLHSVKPIDQFQNDDDASMAANNTCAFCFRTVALKPKEISNHSYGLAIDINPLLNPYISIDGQILPPLGNYDVTRPGTLYPNHPVVQFFKGRGFIWGGDWDKPYKDYQHFHKEISPKGISKYKDPIQQTLDTFNQSFAKK